MGCCLLEVFFKRGRWERNGFLAVFRRRFVFLRFGVFLGILLRFRWVGD